MSDLNPIASTKIAAGQNGGQALQGSSSGVFAAGAGNFWDVILSQLTAAGELASTKKTEAALGATKKPAPAQPENPLAMLQVALASQTLDADGNIVLSADGEKLQTQLDLTNRILNFFKDMVPHDGEKEGLLNTLLSKLQTKSDTLQASIAALESGVITKDTPVEDIPMPLLIALGLNPSEISQVTQRIQELEKKLGREITVEDLIAGVGGLIPSSPDTAILALTAGTKKDAAAQSVIDSIDENTEATDDLAAQLNALDVGGEEPVEEIAPKKANDDLRLKVDGNSKDVPVGDLKAPDTAKTDKAMSFKENLVNILNDMKSQSGDMIFPISFFGDNVDSALYQPYGMAASPALNFGSTAQSANLVSAPVLAGQAHPATQLVAASMTKAGKDGLDTITLRLDPPELGNVNVRLQFGKDKAVKAVVTVEKPETFLMLQREAHNLERALQSAGLETTAESVTFELAQDNSAFSHNDGEANGDKNFGGASNSQDAGAGDDIIQSNMTWQVDQSTGHVRYNIFA